MLSTTEWELLRALPKNKTINGDLKVKLWFDSLLAICNQYLNKRNIYIKESNFIFSGGLIQALSNRNIDFR